MDFGEKVSLFGMILVVFVVFGLLEYALILTVEVINTYKLKKKMMYSLENIFYTIIILRSMMDTKNN